MKITAVITENWLTRKPDDRAFEFTALFTFILLVATMTFQMDMFQAPQWMAATPELVLRKHEYWRAWTTLFAHADLAHILGNSLLLIPFTYFLAGYFGKLIPLYGVAIGGLINFIVLRSLPPDATLIGISGVVYWMGAAWITLFVLVDRRESLRRRVAKALCVALVIFMPEAYKPEISYLSHLLGFVFGIAFAVLFYAIFRARFHAAEKIEYRYEEEESDLLTNVPAEDFVPQNPFGASTDRSACGD